VNRGSDDHRGEEETTLSTLWTIPSSVFLGHEPVVCAASALYGDRKTFRKIAKRPKKEVAVIPNPLNNNKCPVWRVNRWSAIVEQTDE
jgi:hypothetical protein